MSALDPILGNVPLPPTFSDGRRVIAATVAVDRFTPIPALHVLVAGPDRVTARSYPLSLVGMPMPPLKTLDDPEVDKWARELGVEGDFRDRWQQVYDSVYDVVDGDRLFLDGDLFYRVAAATETVPVPA